MNCEYCGTSFKSNKTLKKHQNVAQYCLQKQEQKLAENPFFQIQLIQKDKLIAELQQQLEIYKDMAYHNRKIIESIAKQPHITNNITNIIFLSPFDISEVAFTNIIKEKFTRNHLLLGQKGLAQFVYDNLLKDDDGNLKYICTDPSRRIFRYKSFDGTLHTDINATTLINAISKPIKDKSSELTKENYHSEVIDIYISGFNSNIDLNSTTAKFCNKLASLTFTRHHYS
jgi:hypothetical protein